MSLEIFTALLAFGLVSSITPGPNNMMLLASGTNFGFTRTLPHMCGITIGFMVMVVLVGAGLMQLFDRFPASYQVLQVVSVIYLCFLAWKIATAAPPPRQQEKELQSSRPFSFIQAAMFQWVNPKAWAMALTAISVYTPPSHPLYAVIIVALIFGLVNLPSVAIWALLGTQLRRFLNRPVRLRIFNITMAILLLGSIYPILAGMIK